MDSEKKLRAMLSAIISAQWLAKERYEAGLVALFNDVEDDAEINLLKYVLKALDYRTSDDLVVGARQAAKKILNEWALTPNDTLIVGVAKGSKTCGSIPYVRAIQTELPREWTKQNCIWTTFDSAFKEQIAQTNLVIVDDFLGTGGKLAKLIEKLGQYSKTKKYKIYICCFAGMKAGMSATSTLVSGEVLAYCVYDRCISDRTTNPLKANLLDSMNKMEKKLFSTPSLYRLGYKQSEAAFYLEGYNIPNNNLPIFWRDEYADTSPRQSLFPRR